jgi:hypothetical protein
LTERRPHLRATNAGITAKAIQKKHLSFTPSYAGGGIDPARYSSGKILNPER